MSEFELHSISSDIDEDEIIYQTTSMATISSQPSVVQSEAPLLTDEKLPKRVKTYLLTYIRQNYLKIFFLLLIIILTLIITIVFITLLNTSNVSYQKTEITDQSKLLHDSDMLSQTTRATTEKSEEKQPPPKIGENEEKQPLLKIVCARINCKTRIAPCVPVDINYATIKVYSCCKCLPSNFQLIRYEYNVQLQQHAAFFKLTNSTLVLSRASIYDLKGLPLLQNIQGSWSIVQESDTSFYLKYGGMKVPPPPDDD